MAIVIVGAVVLIDAADYAVRHEAVETISVSDTVLDGDIVRGFVRIEAVGGAVFDFHADKGDVLLKLFLVAADEPA